MDDWDRHQFLKKVICKVVHLHILKFSVNNESMQVFFSFPCEYLLFEQRKQCFDGVAIFSVDAVELQQIIISLY